MAIQPEQLKYLSSHEWASASQEGGQSIATIGISSFAIEQLTDLVFMALPKVGQVLKAGEEFGEVESVKAVSPMYCPVSGEVVAVNDGLVNRLETLGMIHTTKAGSSRSRCRIPANWQDCSITKPTRSNVLAKAKVRPVLSSLDKCTSREAL